MNRSLFGSLIVGVIVLLLFLKLASQTDTAAKDVEPQNTIQKRQEPKQVKAIPVKVVAVKPKPKLKEPDPPEKPKSTKLVAKKKKKVKELKTSQQTSIITSNKSAENKGNSDPAVLATYGLPMQSYLQYMRDNGAQVGLYDASSEKFVGSVKTDGTLGSSIRQNGMSPRARRITSDFPNAQQIMKNARKRFGPGNYEILLLVPNVMDSRFYRNIHQVIGATGRDTASVSLVKIQYLGTSSSITVAVQKLEGRDGSIIVDRSFRL